MTIFCSAFLDMHGNVTVGSGIRDKYCSILLCSCDTVIIELCYKNAEAQGQVCLTSARLSSTQEVWQSGDVTRGTLQYTALYIMYCMVSLIYILV